MARGRLAKAKGCTDWGMDMATAMGSWEKGKHLCDTWTGVQLENKAWQWGPRFRRALWLHPETGRGGKEAEWRARDGSWSKGIKAATGDSEDPHRTLIS